MTDERAIDGRCGCAGDACEHIVWMPLMKSDGSSGDERPIRGCASAEEADLQNESIVQKGMDFGPCLATGYINWDHKEEPKHLLGRLRHMEVVRAEDHPVVAKGGARGLALYVEGFLWPERFGHQGANETWALAKAAEATGLPLGWSVQGRVLERDGKRITKSEIRHLALTHQPIHRRTFAELVKSMTGVAAKSMDTAGAAPTLLENLGDNRKWWKGRLTSVLWGDDDCGHFKRSGEFVGGVRGAMEHLVKCKGHDVRDAHDFVKSLRQSGLLARA